MPCPPAHAPIAWIVVVFGTPGFSAPAPLAHRQIHSRMCMHVDPQEPCIKKEEEEEEMSPELLLRLEALIKAGTSLKMVTLLSQSAFKELAMAVAIRLQDEAPPSSSTAPADGARALGPTPWAPCLGPRALAPIWVGQGGYFQLWKSLAW